MMATEWEWVTNEMYAEFVGATKHAHPPHWIGGTIPHGTERFPVTLVSALDADAYCAWAGKRLPTDEEAVGMDADRPPFVWEWTSATAKDPTGRVVRGGSWFYLSTPLRASFRGRYHPTYRYGSYGFRCASHPPTVGKKK